MTRLFDAAPPSARRGRPKEKPAAARKEKITVFGVTHGSWIPGLERRDPKSARRGGVPGMRNYVGSVRRLMASLFEEGALTPDPAGRVRVGFEFGTKEYHGRSLAHPVTWYRESFRRIAKKKGIELVSLEDSRKGAMLHAFQLFTDGYAQLLRKAPAALTPERHAEMTKKLRSAVAARYNNPARMEHRLGLFHQAVTDTHPRVSARDLEAIGTGLASERSDFLLGEARRLGLTSFVEGRQHAWGIQRKPGVRVVEVDSDALSTRPSLPLEAKPKLLSLFKRVRRIAA
jgi:hypothetical protein